MIISFSNNDLSGSIKKANVDTSVAPLFATKDEAFDAAINDAENECNELKSRNSEDMTFKINEHDIETKNDVIRVICCYNDGDETAETIEIVTERYIRKLNY
jgi:hypothetical protein